MKTMLVSAAVMSTAAFGFAGAAQAQGAKLFLDGDIVRGNQPAGETGEVCVLASQFKRGENVIFRLRVRDVTGKLLDDKGIKGAMVELADGQRLPMRYGGHPPSAPGDWFFSAAWIIPGSYPTGSLTYKVTVTDMQGATAIWEPFKVPASQLTVIPGAVTYTRPQPR
jgi:hypothetical protein